MTSLDCGTLKFFDGQSGLILLEASPGVANLFDTFVIIIPTSKLPSFYFTMVENSDHHAWPMHDCLARTRDLHRDGKLKVARYLNAGKQCQQTLWKKNN